MFFHIFKDAAETLGRNPHDKHIHTCHRLFEIVSSRKALWKFRVRKIFPVGMIFINFQNGIFISGPERDGRVPGNQRGNCGTPAAAAQKTYF